MDEEQGNVIEASFNGLNQFQAAGHRSSSDAGIVLLRGDDDRLELLTPIVQSIADAGGAYWPAKSLPNCLANGSWLLGSG